MVLAGQIENIEPPELWVKYDNGTEEPVAEKHHILAKVISYCPLGAFFLQKLQRVGTRRSRRGDFIVCKLLREVPA